MANKYRGEVPIVLDKRRIVKYDFNAMSEFENETGKNLRTFFFGFAALHGKSTYDAAKHLARELSDKDLRALLYAGLVHEDDELTIKTTGRLMDQAEGENLFEKFTNIFLACLEAWMAIQPKKVQEKALEAEKNLKAELLEKGKASSGSAKSGGASESPTIDSGE